MNEISLDARLSKIQSKMNNANEEVVDKVVLVDINKLQRNELNFYDEEYEIESLVESIKEVGLLTPIQISKNYTILSGHRRYKACQKAGVNKVKCIITDSSDDNILELIEANRHRVKTDEEMLNETKLLQEHYIKLERQGKKPKGRLRELIAKDMGISAATVQRNLNKISASSNSAVSNDTKEISVKSVKEIEFIKLQKLLKKIIKLSESEEIIIDDYTLHNIYKLYDHIDLDAINADIVDINQGEFDF